MQKSPSTAIRESLIDGEVAGEHDAHVVRPVEHLLSLKPSVEVARQMKQPRVLCANFGTDKAHALFPIPVLSACSSRPDFGFQFHRVIVGFRDATGYTAIPRVAVPSSVLLVRFAVPSVHLSSWRKLGTFFW